MPSSESGLLLQMDLFLSFFFFHLYGTVMAKQMLRSKTNANLFADEYILGEAVPAVCFPELKNKQFGPAIRQSQCD